MKKILIMTLVAFAMTFTSCGNKTKTNADATDSVADTTATTTVSAADSVTSALTSELSAKDATTLQATIAAVQTKYAKLVKAGKLEEAKTYASKVQEFINKHATDIKTVAAGNTTIASLVEGIKNLPTSAQTTAEEAAAAVKTDAKTIATDAANTAVNDAKAATVDKGTEAVKAEKTAAEEKVNKKVTESQAKANKAVNNATNKALKGIGL